MSVCKHISKDGLCLLHSEPLYKEPCHEGPCTDYEPLTNGDRIRAMMDEELAGMMIDSIFARCPDGYKGCGLITTLKCKKCWLKWLKQEATE